MTTIVFNSPQSWALPPEPGPEVRAIRDHAGHTWRRRFNGLWDLSSGGLTITWQGLFLGYAPLIDITTVVETRYDQPIYIEAD